MTQSVELAVSGMTCTTCASRIERKLNKIPGVSASVNYATESAHVDFGPDVEVADLLRTIEQTGYAASLVADAAVDDAEVASLRIRFWVSLALALPVVALAMVPVLQFPGWQWTSFVLTTVVVAWGAWPFHRAAAINARHAAATPNLLT